MNTFTNHTFDEIQIGTSISVSHRISKPDAELLVFASGEVDPFDGIRSRKQKMG